MTPNQSLILPDYQTFMEAIAPLALPMSASELHGMMCGYLSAGAADKGESYLRALMLNKNDESRRQAFLTLFDVYTISQQQISSFDFSFQLLLPGEQMPLMTRAQSFSEWCGGFIQVFQMVGINGDDFEEESQEALQHIAEFAELDYEALSSAEDDEYALMEVSEYTRMAVLHIHSDIQQTTSSDKIESLTH